MALTKKQQMFIIEYLKDLNATQAAIRAGYSKNSARQIGTDNLSKTYIAEAIQKEMNKRSERVHVDADDVLSGILDIRDTSMQKITITRENNGEEYQYEKMISPNNALRASELLGKHLKLFTDVVDHNIKEMPIINIVRAKD